jgi:hypothetical protein
LLRFQNMHICLLRWVSSTWNKFDKS